MYRWASAKETGKPTTSDSPLRGGALSFPRPPLARLSEVLLTAPNHRPGANPGEQPGTRVPQACFGGFEPLPINPFSLYSEQRRAGCDHEIEVESQNHGAAGQAYPATLP